MSGRLKWASQIGVDVVVNCRRCRRQHRIYIDAMSGIDYCVSLLDGAPKTMTDWQAAASHEYSCTARITSNTRKFDHGLTQLRRDVLHWLDVADRITFRLCLRLSKLTRHGAIVPVRTVPVCFWVWRTSSSAVIGPQSTRRTSLQSSNRRQTCVWLRTAQYLKYSLPDYFRCSELSLETFKRQLKTFWSHSTSVKWFQWHWHY